MKRFLIFAGPDYYPSGGMGDYIAVRESLEEAISVAKSTSCDWYNIAEVGEKEVLVRLEVWGITPSYQWQRMDGGKVERVSRM